jgi:hypothetical protein
LGVWARAQDGFRHRTCAASAPHEKRGFFNGLLSVVLPLENLRFMARFSILGSVLVSGLGVFVLWNRAFQLSTTQEYQLMQGTYRALLWIILACFSLLCVGLIAVSVMVSMPAIRSPRKVVLDHEKVEASMPDGRTVVHAWEDLVVVRSMGRLQFLGGSELWLFPPRGRTRVMLQILSARLGLGSEFESDRIPSPARLAALMFITGLLGTGALIAWVEPEGDRTLTGPIFISGDWWLPFLV